MTCPELPWKEAFTLMRPELCLVRRVHAENNLLALSFASAEAHPAKRVLFWAGGIL